MNNNWNKTAEYYENIANRIGQDPYSQRSLLWFAETCRARARFGEELPPEKTHRDEAKGESIEPSRRSGRGKG